MNPRQIVPVLLLTLVLSITPSISEAGGFSFTETFSSPPITAGTADLPDPPGDWEDGLVNGDNGWIVVENTSFSGINFGQRTPGVPESSPGGAFQDVCNIRMRNHVDAFFARDLSGTPLVTGNVSLTLSDQLAFFGLGTSQMQLQISTDGGATVGTRLNFGDLTATNRFEAVDGHGTVIAGTTNLTVDARPLLWNNSLDGNPANGDYIVLSVDFDCVSDSASVVITTVDAVGSASSTSPIVVGFEMDVDEISRMVLIAKPPANGHASGSLVWMDTLSITETGIRDTPDLTDIRAETDGSITIEWVSVSNLTYDVEKNVAIEDMFNPIATVTGSAATANYTDTNTVESQGNYRVNLVP